jgi:hypothetical protein
MFSPLAQYVVDKFVLARGQISISGVAAQFPSGLYTHMAAAMPWVGFYCKEEPVHVWVIKGRPLAYC